MTGNVMSQHSEHALLLHEQVQSKQALLQCLGWRLEGTGSVDEAPVLLLRYGHLFRLTLAVSNDQQGSSTEGILELAPAGISQFLSCNLAAVYTVWDTVW